MQPVKHAVITAAGLGSRLGLDIPKCLVPVAGRRIIEHMLPLLTEIPDVRVVVGFRELEVIDVVRRIRPDALFVRNHDYATTSVSHSLHLAVRHLTEPFLIIDGDTIVAEEDFCAFLEHCIGRRNVIGVTQAKTSDAVYVTLDGENNITGFQRSPVTPYEWCGIAYLSDVEMKKDDPFVFNAIEKHLPLPAKSLRCYEIDTPDDLELANHALR
jgi:choline kinase